MVDISGNDFLTQYVFCVYGIFITTMSDAFSQSSSSSFALVIFGATGNLAQLKLIPALYDLAEANLLPEEMVIIGVGRKPLTNEEFRLYSDNVLHQPNHHHQHPVNAEIATSLISKMHYVAGDIEHPEVYNQLNTLIHDQLKCANKLFYLATYPDLYGAVFDQLQQSGLNNQRCGWTRVVIEKPIGKDLRSAKALNDVLAKYYKEDQIFRLDHYLGRETLQNILTFRFGNGFFEPLIHRNYIDHIQVTAAEDFGIGLRGGYFDSVGELKDVGQNHILQMIALATMDPPASFTNESVTNKRVELLRGLVPEPKRIIFGQYQGYRKELGIPKDSHTDTFFAFRTHIDSDRFHGVPLYVRAGKKLHQTVTEVAIVFNVAGKRLFSHIDGGGEPNILIYRIQPNEGIVLRFLSKIPGPELKVQNEYMQFCYHHSTHSLPDPYLRLLADVLKGDQTFFIDAPEVEAQWKFTDALVAAKTNPHTYAPGSWGPREADELIQADGREWLVPSSDFCSR